MTHCLVLFAPRNHINKVPKDVKSSLLQVVVALEKETKTSSPLFKPLQVIFTWDRQHLTIANVLLISYPGAMAAIFLGAPMAID